MKDFKIKKSDVVNFWKNYGNYTFFGLSLLCAALVVPLMWCNNLIFWLGVIASFIMFLRLKFAFIEIEDAFLYNISNQTTGGYCHGSRENRIGRG